MFSDSEINITGFDPCPEAEKLVKDGSSQTLTLKTSSEGTQTAAISSSGVQAVPEVPDLAGKSESYDANKLLAFLKRILPDLEEELKNYESNVNKLNFKDENGPSFNGLESDRQQDAIQSFSKSVSIKPEYCKEKIISSVTWNSSGTLLALASCEKNHEGWCCHESCVGIYSTGKNKFEKSPPDHLLKVSACVRCVQFHSYIPSLLAGGFHNGDVVIWDLTNDEAVMTNLKRSDKEGVHVDAVTCLVWREDRNGVWLVSTARDGKVIFWKVTITNLTCEAYERYLILKQHTTPITSPVGECYEVMSISFFPNQESNFVVAAGANVFHCFLKTAKNLTSTPGYKDPVSMSYKPHEGIVTSVSCCPMSDIFASCGMDSKIHIYKFEHSTPVHVIHTNFPLMGTKWAYNNKCLISWGCSSKAEYHKVNLEEERHISQTICEVDGFVSAIELNLSRQGKIAVGNTTGEVLILNDAIFQV